MLEGSGLLPQGEKTSHPERTAADRQMIQAGAAANRAAADFLFADYRQRRAEKTLRTQKAALVLWVEYLSQVGAVEALSAAAVAWAQNELEPAAFKALVDYADSQPAALIHVVAAHYCQAASTAWIGITWGLVEGFVKWLLNQGYSVASVNNRLSAVKVYARLAARAGAIPPTEHALIKEVRGYGLTEGKRLDEKRQRNRIGYKKREAIVLSAAQAGRLKSHHPPTPQGLRDRLLICLLLDLGLRASEAAALRVEDLEPPQQIAVYRQKTDSLDRMILSRDLLQALADYAPYRRPQGILLRGSRKNGKLTQQVMSVRAIGSRVKLLGRDILGIWELSPHDLRHTWATRAASGSNPFALRDAGGWSNMQTPGRYVERAQVVNEGIELDY